MDLRMSVWGVMQRFKLDEAISMKTGRSSILRKLLPRSRAYHRENFEFQVSDKLKILINRSDYTQWRLFSGGLSVNREIFRYLTVREDQFFMLDIGANIGGFTILMAQEVKTEKFHVHLFEPNPKVFSTLKENISRLRASNPEVHASTAQLALGEKEAVLPLKVDDDHSGLATLGVPESFGSTVDVKVLSLDSYIMDKKIPRVDFIKMDVESFEPAVLAGARNTMREFRPVLYMEYGIDWFTNFTEEQIRDLLTFFHALGYCFYREARSGELIDLPMTIESLQEYNHLNILAVCKAAL